MRSILFSVLILLHTLPALTAQSGNTRTLQTITVSGNTYSIDIALPGNWNADTDYARQIGRAGFFISRNYPYVSIVLNVVDNPGQKVTLDEWIQSDISGFLFYNRGYSVEKIDRDIKNENGYRMEIYAFKDAKGTLFQYAAIFDPELTYFANLVVSAALPGQEIKGQLLEDFILVLTNIRFDRNSAEN